MGAINTCHGHMMGSGPGSLKDVQGFLRLHTRSGWNCSSGYGLELGTYSAQSTHFGNQQATQRAKSHAVISEFKATQVTTSQCLRC